MCCTASRRLCSLLVGCQVPADMEVSYLLQIELAVILRSKGGLLLSWKVGCSPMAEPVGQYRACEVPAWQ